MKRLTPRSLLFLAIDVALLVLCILHIPSLVNRAEAPMTARDSGERVIVSDILDPASCTNVRTGDELVLWNGTRVTSSGAIEFLAEMSLIGTRIPLTLERNAGRVDAFIDLVPAYTFPYVVIVCFVALATWCLGLFVLLARPGDLIASTLHWAMIMMAVTIVTAYEGTTPANRTPFLSSMLFFLSYAGTATSFFLFTALFPRTKPGSLLLKSALVFLPTLTILGFMIFHHTRALLLGSVDEFILYDSWFKRFHILLLLYVAGGIFSFIHSYVTAATTDEKRKLQWILWGLSLAPVPFLALVIIPRQLNLVPLVPEEYTILLLLVIPVSFVISFVRHRLLDIELVIRRTTAYALVIGGLLVVYALFISAAASFVGQLTASTVAAITVALLFEPFRRRVQHFVDRRFFRTQYNSRQARLRFVELTKQSLTVPQLGNTLVNETHALIPVERIGFFMLKRNGKDLLTVAQRGFEPSDPQAPRFESEKISSIRQLPVGVAGSLEPGVPHESADEEMFHRWGLALAFAFLSKEGKPLGFLMLGPRKSGLRFSIEDIELLKDVCTQTGLAIERIMLQEDLLMEQAESRHLKELSQLKSDFVSYVSHELRTPITSIKMFADLLRSRPRKLDRKGTEYLNIIEGESNRLERMVTTILDSAKIDKDMMVYEFHEADLVDIAKSALASMHYQLKKQGFHIEPGGALAPGRNGVRSARPVQILADRYAVVQAITNLITNAIKYSAETKFIRVSVVRKGEQALCGVQDKGLGISGEAIPHLFEKFYRDPAHAGHARGVGLGLPLVRHIMEAHGGTVEVKSSRNKGSTFTLAFPLMHTALDRGKKSPAGEEKEIIAELKG